MASNRDEFWLEEYRQLRAELLYHMSADESIRRENIVGSAAIYAWFLSIENPFRANYITDIVLIIPALLVVINLLRQRWHMNALWQIAGRITDLEKYFAHNIALPHGGWEEYLVEERKAKIHWIHKIQKYQWIMYIIIFIVFWILLRSDIRREAVTPAIPAVQTSGERPAQ